jgi:quinoprotein glucose dehydrogenase
MAVFLIRSSLPIAGCAILIACGGPSPEVDYSGPVAQWHHVGGSQERQQYSPLNQVNGDNVASLEVAWVHNSGDFARGGDGSGKVTAFEASPLMVNDTLYYCG